MRVKTSRELVAAIKQCAKAKDLERGKKLHLEATGAKLDRNRYVGAALISLYAKCGSIPLAREVFDGMTDRDVVSWNALIMGCVENKNSSVALEVFSRMDCDPNHITFVAAVKACASLRLLERGMGVHQRAEESGFTSDLLVATTLLDMYSKCGSMQHARRVFDRMTNRNVITWTSLILGYVDNGESYTAMELFRSMDCAPDSVTYVAAFKACANLATETEDETRRKMYLDQGISIHKQASELGFTRRDMSVANAVITMYAKCGSMPLGREAFESMARKDTITWTSLILGYAENGESPLALDMFSNMNSQPDAYTFVAALKACANLAMNDKKLGLRKGMEIHKQAKELGLETNMFVANTLMDVYTKSARMELARAVFDRMVAKNVVSWTCMVMGYAENGQSVEAMDLFMNMDSEPNHVTFVAALKACERLAPAVGQHVHARICKLGLERSHMVTTALLDFYGKRGNTAAAHQVFGCISCPSVVSWNALIAGYTALGDTSQLLRLVAAMLDTGLQINNITSLSVLTACNHAGMVEDGMKHFRSMSSKYGISPGIGHYNCIIGMLGRANRLQEALALVKEMPFEADSVTWKTLLGACEKWNNVEVGKLAFDALAAGEKELDASACVIMGNMFQKCSLREKQQVHLTALTEELLV